MGQEGRATAQEVIHRWALAKTCRLALIRVKVVTNQSHHNDTGSKAGLELDRPDDHLLRGADSTGMKRTAEDALSNLVIEKKVIDVQLDNYVADMAIIAYDEHFNFTGQEAVAQMEFAEKLIMTANRITFLLDKGKALGEKKELKAQEKAESLEDR